MMILYFRMIAVMIDAMMTLTLTLNVDRLSQHVRSAGTLAKDGREQCQSQ